ncbi:MAG: KilA-N domain-containing protein [Bacteroidota bacterium]
MKELSVEGEKIRVSSENNYICITDIAKLKGNPSLNIQNWLRNRNSIAFFEAWEVMHNPSFNPFEFEGIKKEAGLNTHYISANDLIKAGCIGIKVKRGRYGGTYCAPDWAIHFANWLDARFYVGTINAYRVFTQELYGEYFQVKRITRELAAENFKLVTSAAFKQLPESADELFERHIASVEADILNLALWGMTASEWRIKFPDQHKKTTRNMRDYATPEELKTLASLEVLSQEMQQTGYTTEQRLDRLRTRSQELLSHYVSTEDKLAVLTLAQKKRGWGYIEME